MTQKPYYPPGNHHAQNLSDEAKAELGISDGLLQISLGLEDTDDLVEDVEAALKVAR